MKKYNALLVKAPGTEYIPNKDWVGERSQSKVSWVVPRDLSPARLDAFVHSCLPHLSLREIRRAIDERLFLVNSRPATKGQTLFPGDVLSVPARAHLLAKGPLPNPAFIVNVLFEDDAFLVVEKPAALASHGFSARDTRTLVNFLVARYPSQAGVGKSPWEAGLINRLDRGTSGLVLVAKDRESFENLRSQFHRRWVQKKYWALVWGNPPEDGSISYALAHDPADRRKMKAFREEAKGTSRMKWWKASTQFRTHARTQSFSLIEVQIRTGVTHQIRAHFQEIGHPLVGDPLYGGGQADPFGLGRQFLHASCLGFLHPKSGEAVAFESPLPSDLRKVLDRLGIQL